MARQDDADRILRRAEALEDDLISVLRRLDPGRIRDFTTTVLEMGVIDDALLADIYEKALGQTLISTYEQMGADAAEDMGVARSGFMLAVEANYAVAKLVREMTEKARAAIAADVDRALAQGWGVDKLAREIRDKITLTETQNRWVANYEAELRTKPGDALRRQLRDRRFDPALLRGDVQSESRIQRQVERYRERWTMHRARLIAQVETLRAGNAANFATMSEAVERGDVPRYVRKWWWHSHDTHVRDAHHAIPGLNRDGVALNEAFITPLGPMRYPLDPLGTVDNVAGCRCVLVIETRSPERFQ